MPPRSWDRWFVDETYVKVVERCTYLYRAVDQYGQVIDVLLSLQRDHAAAWHFFTRALRSGTVPAVVTTDRAPVYPLVGERTLADIIAEAKASEKAESREGHRQARRRRPARPAGHAVAHPRRRPAHRAGSRSTRPQPPGRADRAERPVRARHRRRGAGRHRGRRAHRTVADPRPGRRPAPRHRPQDQRRPRSSPAPGPRRRPVVDDDKRAAILARRQCGESIRTIAAGVKVSIGVVHKTLTEARQEQQP